MAKWARCLGVDATFFPDSNKAHYNVLFEIARKEGRVIVTQNRAMIKRRTCPAHMLVTKQTPVPSFQEVAQYFGFTLDAATFYSRCTSCNGTFRKVTLEEMRRMPFVPEAYKKAGLDDSRQPLGKRLPTAALVIAL